MSTPPAPLSEADYSAIEAAVLETARGRWFLAEYARRNRHADTLMLIAALDRIEAAAHGERSVDTVDRIRFDLVEMAKAIARTKAEIASIKPDEEHHGKFGEATSELDSIVQATETATSDILAAAERVQEIAWTLREQGLEPGICDVLDSKATEVYTACSFQDLTGQRTRKVIQVMRYLEARINAMIKIWGLGGAMAAEAAENEHAHSEAALLNGPALPGQGLDQGDIDIVMAPAEHATSAARTPMPEASTADAVEDVTAPDAGIAPGSDDLTEVGDVPEGGPMPAVHKTATPVRAEPVFMAAAEPMAPPLQPAADAAVLPTRPAEGAAVRAGASEDDPLATVTALSFEEKVALFT
jgi:chemotaxis regulatin CheY-phosphate phosphatase CheZ